MYDYVDLFAGAGGWDLAARAFGLSTLGVELWEPANQTRWTKGLDTLATSVLECNPEDPWFDATGFIASPPCQTFSRTGGGSGRGQMETLCQEILAWNEDFKPNDPRTALTLEPLRWITCRYTSGNPYTRILLEQVPEVQRVWDSYGKALALMGYSVWTGVLNAQDYSTPQSRRRAILVAHLEREMNKPVPNSLEPISWDTALAITNPNSVLESNYKGHSGPKPEGGKWPLGRRGVGEPSWTVTGRAHKLIHNADEKPVRLSAAQMGLLQGFPANYPWQGSKGEQRLQAGNAIPVPLAKALLQHVS